MSRLRWLAWLWLAGAAAAQQPEVDRLRFCTMWDEQYLYIGAQFDDINVVGRHSGPSDEVWRDDDVELFFETDNRRSDKLTGACVWLGMSAAEGLWFARGSAAADGRWLPQNLLALGAQGFRQAVRVHGTLNDTADADRGWEVEAAIPWAMFGRSQPALGEVWGFNLVRNLRGETDARFSYVKGATAPEAHRRPASWGWIAFRGRPGGPDATGWIEPGDEAVVICPSAGEGKVRIDGRVGPDEWPYLYGLALELTPDRLLPLTPETYPPPPDRDDPLPEGCDYRPLEVPPRPERGPYEGERLVLAGYVYDYQDDERQPRYATHGVRRPDGSCFFTQHPLEGLGPWFSGLRSGWHYEQLERAAEAHVDVLLAVESPAEPALRAAALDSLVLALGDLHRYRRPHPGLGLLIPLETLTARLGEDLDLTRQVTQATLYETIRDFFERVPPPLRAQVADGSRQCCLVALSAPSRRVRLTQSFLAYCEARFRSDFGLDLLWLGPPEWRRRGVALDATISLEAGLAPLYDSAGRIHTLSVGPGWDDSGTSYSPRRRPRLGRQTFRDGFALASPADYQWLFFPSWNDYRRGDNIAASTEYGELHERTAALLALQFNAPEEKPWVAVIRRFEAPDVIGAGMAVQCPVQIVNGGMRPWSASDRVQLSYRWHPDQPQLVRKRDGTVLLDQDGKPVYRDLPLTENGGRSEILTGPTRAVLDTVLPVIAVDDQGAPLPPGRYRLRLDALAGESETEQEILDQAGNPVLDERGKPRTRLVRGANWFSLRDDPTFDVRITVAPPAQLPAQAGTVLEVQLPPRLETGQRYPIWLRARNDGSRPWTGPVRAAVRWEMVSATPPCLAPRAPEPLGDWLPLADVMAAARRDVVRPGEVVGLSLELPVRRPDGTPLPVTDGVERRVRAVFALLDADGQPLPARRTYAQSAEILARDDGAGFWRIEIPGYAPAGAKLACRVTVVNTGFHTWPAGQAAVGCSWYYPDGVEAAYDVARAPVPVELASGGSVEVHLEVPTPAFPGAYTLAFDVLHEDERRGSQQPSTYVGDSARRTVILTGGLATPVDLSRIYNVVARGSEAQPAAADFDGHGLSLPAEQLPPGAYDLGRGLYPAGLFGPTAAPGPSWRRAIPFRYEAFREGKPDAVQPTGQVAPVPTGRYLRLHVLGASVDEDATAAFAVRGPGGQRPLDPVTLTTWDRPAAHGELLGLRLDFRRGPDGDRLGQRAWLHHATVGLDAGAPIDAIVMPNQPLWRILALTLESASAE